MGSKRPNDSKETGWKSKKITHWSVGLISSLEDPEMKVLEDDLVTAIKDKYPKATHHFLVCPKKKINSLKHVTVEDLELLKHMDETGKKISGDHKDFKFLIGYHAIPSMQRLHLHVISDDFDSPCLKTKKHWNSFNSKFFLHSEKVIEELEKEGKINFISAFEGKELLDQTLMCNKCSFSAKGMPALKDHLKTHL